MVKSDIEVQAACQMILPPLLAVLYDDIKCIIINDIVPT